MWILRWIGVLILMIIILWFSLQNLDQLVTIKFWSYQIIDVPLIMALFVAFITGVVTWFIVLLYQFLQMKLEINGLRRENVRLQRECAEMKKLTVVSDSTESKTDAGDSED